MSSRRFVRSSRGGGLATTESDSDPDLMGSVSELDPALGMTKRRSGHGLAKIMTGAHNAAGSSQAKPPSPSASHARQPASHPSAESPQRSRPRFSTDTAADPSSASSAVASHFYKKKMKTLLDHVKREKVHLDSKFGTAKEDEVTTILAAAAAAANTQTRADEDLDEAFCSLRIMQSFDQKTLTSGLMGNRIREEERERMRRNHGNVKNDNSYGGRLSASTRGAALVDATTTGTADAEERGIHSESALGLLETLKRDKNAYIRSVKAKQRKRKFSIRDALSESQQALSETKEDLNQFLRDPLTQDFLKDGKEAPTRLAKEANKLAHNKERKRRNEKEDIDHQRRLMLEQSASYRNQLMGVVSESRKLVEDLGRKEEAEWKRLQREQASHMDGKDSTLETKVRFGNEDAEGVHDNAEGDAESESGALRLNSRPKKMLEDFTKLVAKADASFIRQIQRKLKKGLDGTGLSLETDADLTLDGLSPRSSSGKFASLSSDIHSNGSKFIPKHLHPNPAANLIVPCTNCGSYSSPVLMFSRCQGFCSDRCAERYFSTDFGSQSDKDFTANDPLFKKMLSEMKKLLDSCRYQYDEQIYDGKKHRDPHQKLEAGASKTTRNRFRGSRGRFSATSPTGTTANLLLDSDGSDSSDMDSSSADEVFSDSSADSTKKNAKAPAKSESPKSSSVEWHSKLLAQTNREKHIILTSSKMTKSMRDEYQKLSNTLSSHQYEVFLKITLIFFTYADPWRLRAGGYWLAHCPLLADCLWLSGEKHDDSNDHTNANNSAGSATYGKKLSGGADSKKGSSHDHTNDISSYHFWRHEIQHPNLKFFRKNRKAQKITNSHSDANLTVSLLFLHFFSHFREEQRASFEPVEQDLFRARWEFELSLGKMGEKILDGPQDVLDADNDNQKSSKSGDLKSDSKSELSATKKTKDSFQQLRLPVSVRSFFGEKSCGTNNSRTPQLFLHEGTAWGSYYEIIFPKTSSGKELRSFLWPIERAEEVLERWKGMRDTKALQFAGSKGNPGAEVPLPGTSPEWTPLTESNFKSYYAAPDSSAISELTAEETQSFTLLKRELLRCEWAAAGDDSVVLDPDGEPAMGVVLSPEQKLFREQQLQRNLHFSTLERRARDEHLQRRKFLNLYQPNNLHDFLAVNLNFSYAQAVSLQSHIKNEVVEKIFSFNECVEEVISPHEWVRGIMLQREASSLGTDDGSTKDDPNDNPPLNNVNPAIPRATRFLRQEYSTDDILHPVLNIKLICSDWRECFGNARVLQVLCRSRNRSQCGPFGGKGFGEGMGGIEEGKDDMADGVEEGVHKTKESDATNFPKITLQKRTPFDVLVREKISKLRGGYLQKKKKSESSEEDEDGPRIKALDILWIRNYFLEPEEATGYRYLEAEGFVAFEPPKGNTNPNKGNMNAFNKKMHRKSNALPFSSIRFRIEVHMRDFYRKREATANLHRWLELDSFRNSFLEEGRFADQNDSKTKLAVQPSKANLKSQTNFNPSPLIPSLLGFQQLDVVAGRKVARICEYNSSRLFGGWSGEIAFTTRRSKEHSENEAGKQTRVREAKMLFPSGEKLETKVLDMGTEGKLVLAEKRSAISLKSLKPFCLPIFRQFLCPLGGSVPAGGGGSGSSSSSNRTTPMAGSKTLHPDSTIPKHLRQADRDTNTAQTSHSFSHVPIMSYAPRAPALYEAAIGPEMERVSETSSPHGAASAPLLPSTDADFLSIFVGTYTGGIFVGDANPNHSDKFDHTTVTSFPGRSALFHGEGELFLPKQIVMGMKEGSTSKSTSHVLHPLHPSLYEVQEGSWNRGRKQGVFHISRRSGKGWEKTRSLYEENMKHDRRRRFIDELALSSTATDSQLGIAPDQPLVTASGLDKDADENPGVSSPAALSLVSSPTTDFLLALEFDDGNPINTGVLFVDGFCFRCFRGELRERISRGQAAKMYAELTAGAERRKLAESIDDFKRGVVEVRGNALYEMKVKAEREKDNSSMLDKLGTSIIAGAADSATYVGSGLGGMINSSDDEGEKKDLSPLASSYSFSALDTPEDAGDEKGKKKKQDQSGTNAEHKAGNKNHDITSLLSTSSEEPTTLVLEQEKIQLHDHLTKNAARTGMMMGAVLSGEAGLKFDQAIAEKSEGRRFEGGHEAGAGSISESRFSGRHVDETGAAADDVNGQENASDKRLREEQSRRHVRTEGAIHDDAEVLPAKHGIAVAIGNLIEGGGEAMSIANQKGKEAHKAYKKMSWAELHENVKQGIGTAVESAVAAVSGDVEGEGGGGPGTAANAVESGDKTEGSDSKEADTTSKNRLSSGKQLQSDLLNHIDTHDSRDPVFSHHPFLDAASSKHMRLPTATGSETLFNGSPMATEPSSAINHLVASPGRPKAVAVSPPSHKHESPKAEKKVKQVDTKSANGGAAALPSGGASNSSSVFPPNDRPTVTSSAPQRIRLPIHDGQIEEVANSFDAKESTSGEESPRSPASYSSSMLFEEDLDPDDPRIKRLQQKKYGYSFDASESESGSHSGDDRGGDGAGGEEDENRAQEVRIAEQLEKMERERMEKEKEEREKRENEEYDSWLGGFLGGGEGEGDANEGGGAGGGAGGYG